MSIMYSKKAKKFLDKQNEETRNRIIIAIEKLPSGDEEYQPCITHEDLKQQFGIK